MAELGRPVGTASAPDRRSRRRKGLKPAEGTPKPFAEWCAANLVQTTDRWAGEKLVLESWQLEFMQEALEADEAGRFRWPSVALVVPRKNGKTTMLAAYALWRLLQDKGQPEIL